MVIPVVKIKPTDRIFFLDDDDNRVRTFIKMLHGIKFDMDNFDCAEDIECAKIYLEEEKQQYDWYFLDHDLLPEHYGNSKYDWQVEGTGKEIIQHIKNTPQASFVLHSWNKVGRDRMEGLLYRRGANLDKIIRAKFGDFVLENA